MTILIDAMVRIAVFCLESSVPAYYLDMVVAFLEHAPVFYPKI
jgi:hypothetical protein